MCPPWLGCCVRLAGLVSQFVSHLALSFTLAGVLCPPRWACLRICLPRWACLRSCLLICLPPGFVFHVLPIYLPICLPSGFVFHLGWGAASASLGLSPVLSPNLSPNLSPTWLCLLRWLGCCVRLVGLVSQFVSHLGFVFHLGWGAVSASLGLSPIIPQTVYGWGSQCFLSVSALTGMLCPPRWACLRSCLPPCLPSGLGCCVRLAGLVFLLSAVQRGQDHNS